MIHRILIALTITLAMAAAAETASAQSANRSRTVATPARARAAQREAIRQMPLLTRPDRPGHFYGNTVRRVHRRRHGW